MTRITRNECPRPVPPRPDHRHAGSSRHASEDPPAAARLPRSSAWAGSTTQPMAMDLSWNQFGPASVEYAMFAESSGRSGRRGHLQQNEVTLFDRPTHLQPPRTALSSHECVARPTAPDFHNVLHSSWERSIRRSLFGCELRAHLLARTRSRRHIHEVPRPAPKGGGRPTGTPPRPYQETEERSGHSHDGSSAGVKRPPHADLRRGTVGNLDYNGACHGIVHNVRFVASWTAPTGHPPMSPARRVIGQPAVTYSAREEHSGLPGTARPRKDSAQAQELAGALSVALALARRRSLWSP